MKKFLILTLVSLSCYALPNRENLIAIDGIRVAIFSPEGTAIITKTEAERPGIDGMIRSLDDQIFEKRVYQEAKEKYPVSQEDIDKQLANVAKMNNMSPSDLDAMFRQAHYTPEEGREQFGVMTVVNQIISYKVHSQVVIPEKEKHAYFDAHPIIEQAEYLLQRGIILHDNEDLVEDIDDQLKQNPSFISITWSDPFWIKEDELAPDKKFLTSLPLALLSPAKKIEVGFEVFRVKDKKNERLVSYEEREQEITELLRRPEYTRRMQEYQNELFKKATIVRFDKEN